MLKEIEEEIKNCSKCNLHKTRINVVPGEGNKNAEIFFVGEAPGEQEDLQGRPFVGRAGELLTELLNSIGLSREDVFIGNILKCRPPKNRDPLDEEIEKCKDYLIAQIAIIKPKVICLLGRHAMRTLLEKDFKITEVHGKIFKKHNILFIPMFHPAASLHRNSEQMRQMMKNDFKRLKGLFKIRKS